MQVRSRALVRALLPLLPLCLYHALGGGSHAEAASAATQPAPASSAAPKNAPPVMTLAAIADAQVGGSFDYLPATKDPENDTLRFTAVNLPPWASIDTSTGRIHGTPGPTDEGLYESISITVNPAPASSGVASLQWEIPPSKVDGEPLDDLAGYRILYGRNSSDLDQSVLITDPATTSYQFSTLSSGTWYFAVVAVNAGGFEGPPTILASKSI